MHTTIGGLRAKSITVVVLAAVLLVVTSCASKDPAPSNQAVTASPAAGTTIAVSTTAAPTTTTSTSTTTSTTAAPPTTKKPTSTTAKRATTTKPSVNDPAFTPDVQQVFLGQCEKDTGNPNLPPQTRSAICKCVMAEVIRTMTFDEFNKIGLEMASGQDVRTTALWPILLECSEPYLGQS